MTVKSGETPVLGEASMGFRALMGTPWKMPMAHSHMDMEWNLVLRGHMRYFIAGRFHRVGAGRLGIFWAGTPHRMVDFAPDTSAIWVNVPLAWFVQWNIREDVVSRLLAGEVLDAPMEPNVDRARMTQWTTELSAAGPLRRAAALEVEARMHRHAEAVINARRTSAISGRDAVGRNDIGRPARGGAPVLVSTHGRMPVDAPGGDAVERMVVFMGRSYQEELSVAQIAAAARLQPNYAMQLFKSGCGMSIWAYLTRMRISHAQRLLLTTDEKITRIALESGFASSARFYAAFARVAGQTPSEFRSAQTLAWPPPYNNIPPLRP